MRRMIDYLTKAQELVLVLLIGSMALMVFLNVVLRYGFNSGIAMSEELSRVFFVWLTFIGAVVTFKEGAHLGVETLVRMFGRRGRVICMGLSEALILFCVTILFWGTWMQAPINATMRAPVSGMPMSLVFGITFFTAAGIGIIAAFRLFRIVTGRITEAEIAAFAGEMDDPAKLAERAE